MWTPLRDGHQVQLQEEDLRKWFSPWQLLDRRSQSTSKESSLRPRKHFLQMMILLTNWALQVVVKATTGTHLRLTLVRVESIKVSGRLTSTNQPGKVLVWSSSLMVQSIRVWLTRVFSMVKEELRIKMATSTMVNGKKARHAVRVSSLIRMAQCTTVNGSTICTTERVLSNGNITRLSTPATS